MDYFSQSNFIIYIEIQIIKHWNTGKTLCNTFFAFLIKSYTKILPCITDCTIASMKQQEANLLVCK